MAKKSKYTYDMIAPLIVVEEVDGRQLYLEFALPGSEEIYPVQTSIKRASDAGGKIKRRMVQVARNQARRGASQAIRGALGGGMVGRMGYMTFNSAAREVRPGEGPTSAEIKTTIVMAFAKVEKYFHYNEDTEEWEKPGVPPPPPPKSPFEEQIAANPIADPHDKNIFARIMAELAYADGTITPEEAEFFKSFIPPDQPSLDVLAKADPVSKIEATEVTEGVKATIYMFAWVIALIDMDLDMVEEELLMEYADVFNLTDTRREELTRFSKYFVLERNIDPDIPRDELFQLADKVKLSHDEAERCRIAYKRRVG